MKKRYLLFVALLSVLVLFPSCKKKDDPALSSPVVTVAEDKTEKNVVSPEEAKTTVAPVPQAAVAEGSGESANKERKLSVVYRGGKILLKATFGPDEATISTNMDSASISFASARLAEEKGEYLSVFTFSVEGSNVVLSYSPSLPDEYLHSFWNDIKSLLDKMNEEAEERSTEEEEKKETRYTVSGIPLALSVYSDRAEITLPSFVERGDLEAFFSFLSSSNPGLAEKAWYEINGDTVSLHYGEGVTEEDVPLLWNELLSEIEAFVAAPVEETNGLSSPDREESEEKKTLSSLLSRAGKTIGRMTLSLSASAKYDPTVTFASVFKAQFAYSLSEEIKIGGGFGYDTASFIPLFGTLRYDLSVLDGLYAYGDLGWRFALGDKSGSFFLDLGAGYEKSVSESFILFGEVQAQMVFSPEVRLMPSLALGVRYSF